MLRWLSAGVHAIAMDKNLLTRKGGSSDPRCVILVGRWRRRGPGVVCCDLLDVIDAHDATSRAGRPKHDRGSHEHRDICRHAIDATNGFRAGAVVGKPITSAHQSKTLEPTWREVHDFDCEDGSLAFKCVVEDYDAMSKADHMVR